MNEKRKLIYADDLLAQFPVGGGVTAARARRAIERAETVDAVEIVRCRDCKNSSRIASEKEDGMRHCWSGRGKNKGDGMSRVRSDGYCDEGIRKEAHNG